jgi:hypothetical protein
MRYAGVLISVRLAGLGGHTGLSAKIRFHEEHDGWSGFHCPAALIFGK